MTDTFLTTTPTDKVELSAVSLDVKDMTDRELLEEVVVTMRTVGQALAAFQKMGPGGIMKMMMGR